MSRISGSLFWIGRYLERGEGTARILDAHLQLLLEDPWIEEDLACRSLLRLMRCEPPAERRLTRKDVLSVLGVDRGQPASIACSLGAARETARHAREAVSAELWDCLNATCARMPRSVASEKAHDFFAWVRERSALAVGIVETGTPRDEGWVLFALGRSLEQADMTARLLATRSLTETGGASWGTILRSGGAYESYLRAHPGIPAGPIAAEYLLLDPLFPRSIGFSVSRAEQYLRGLEPRAELAQQLLGQVRGLLESDTVDEIVADLPSRMVAVRDAVATITEAVCECYFPAEAARTAVPTGTSGAS